VHRGNKEIVPVATSTKCGASQLRPASSSARRVQPQPQRLWTVTCPAQMFVLLLEVRAQGRNAPERAIRGCHDHRPDHMIDRKGRGCSSRVCAKPCAVPGLSAVLDT
jgi:hypothetical protein